ncbi:monocarboxylate transporter 12-B-like [Watersipora subatra]|uniref:monocarboxylate transporter 12-B-like n=1 Tax=Watersipora subatra TaxID=2589382 RepID=UPI00355B62E1
MISLLLNITGYVGLAYSRTLPAMFLTHSILSGMGESAMLLGPLIVSAPYFRKRKALAVGIIASGSGIGWILLPYVYRYLFDNYEYSGAFLLVGGCYLQLLIPASLLRPISFYSKQLQPNSEGIEEEPNVNSTHRVSLVEQTELETLTSQQEEITVEPESRQSHSDDNISSTDEVIIASSDDHDRTPLSTKNDENSRPIKKESDKKDKFIWRVILLPKFYIVVVSIALYTFGSFATFQALPSLAKEAGLSKETVAVAMMIAGVGEIPSRIANGFLADKKLVTITTQYALAMLISGLMCLICAFISGLAGIALVLIGMSLLGTSVMSIIPVVINELLGAQYITSGMSIQIFLQSFGYVFSSFVTGAIYDTSGSWRIVFFYIASVMISASTVVWPYCLVRWCRENCKRPEPSQNEELYEIRERDVYERQEFLEM